MSIIWLLSAKLELFVLAHLHIKLLLQQSLFPLLLSPSRLYFEGGAKQKKK
jgi:hypothetical protein